MRLTTAFLTCAALAAASAAQAATINTSNAGEVATFQAGATVQTFEGVSGRTPLPISNYNGGDPIPDAAKLFDQITGLQFTVGGAPGDSPAALLQLNSPIDGDAASKSTVVGPATMAPDQVTDFQGGFIEIIFATKVSRVGFWLNPSLGNVLLLANDQFGGSQLESLNGGLAGNFIGIERATADIGHISIIPLQSGGFTIDDLTYAASTTPPPPTSVPEPGTLALVGLGLAGVLARRRG